MKNLTGFREIFRRLEEQNDGHRTRLNRIRDIGGVPHPEPRVYDSALSSFVIPNQQDWEQLRRTPLSRIQSETPIIMYGRQSNRTYPSPFSVYDKVFAEDELWLKLANSQITFKDYMNQQKIKEIQSSKTLINNNVRFLLDSEY